MITFLVMTLIFIVVTVWCCLVVAKRTDDEMEKLYKRWEEEHEI